MKCIYNYLSLLRDATVYFAKKYKVSKEESLSLSLKCLITFYILQPLFENFSKKIQKK